MTTPETTTINRSAAEYRPTTLTMQTTAELYTALRAVLAQHPGVSMHRLMHTLLWIALTIAPDHPEVVRERLAELFPAREPQQD